VEETRATAPWAALEESAAASETTSFRSLSTPCSLLTSLARGFSESRAWGSERAGLAEEMASARLV
jgi:hypothetical protein